VFALAPPPTSNVETRCRRHASRTFAKDVLDRDPLETRGEIGLGPLVELVGAARESRRLAARRVRGPALGHAARRVEKRGLQPAEREIETALARLVAAEPYQRQVVGPVVPAAGQGVDLGAAGVAEAEDRGGLVERLADRVVDRRAEALEPERIAHEEEARVAA
jgi:hypothetical protein